MKKLIFILLFVLIGFSYGQRQDGYRSHVLIPFAVGNDTILSAANLVSSTLDINVWRGAVTLVIQPDTMTAGGTTAANIDVYFQTRFKSYSWGVPVDSVAADSIHLGTITSADVTAEEPYYFPLSAYTWWSYFDEIRLILDPAGGADSIKINSVLKGQ